MKICICGSMTAARKMLEAKEVLEERGHSIVMPEFTEVYAGIENSDNIHSESAKNKIEHDLIRNHYKKIKESDAVLIINEERKGIPSYIGGNSLLEMGFAYVLDKEIYLLNDIPEMPYTDEIKAMNPVCLKSDLSSL